MAGRSECHLLVQPSTDEDPVTLHRRLQQVGHRVALGTAPPLPEGVFSNAPVVATAVGPAHIAFLCGDGQVYRMHYTIHPGNMDLQAVPSNGRSNSPSALFRSSEPPPRTRIERLAAESGSSPMMGRGGSAAGRGGTPASRGRGAPHRYFYQARRPAVPASSVPDELVARVLEILPNKSRQTVVRQLQRSGLDVDAAVNHLLMNEDEGEEGFDDQDANDDHEAGLLDASLRGHITPDFDLMGTADLGIPDSLHGGGPFGAVFMATPGVPYVAPASAYHLFGSPEGNVPLPPGAAGSPQAVRASRGAAMRERASLDRGERRWREREREREHDREHDRNRDRERFEALLRREHARGGGNGGSSGGGRPVSSGDVGGPKRKPMASEPPVEISPGSPAYSYDGPVELWQPTVSKSQRVPMFTTIVGMHSALLAVTGDGKLWHWRWDSQSVAGGLHPRVGTSGFDLPADYQVQRIATSPFRCTLLLADNTLVTLLDDACLVPELGRLATPLEHGPLPAPHDAIVDLDVSDTMTMLLTQGGRIYWWGLLPLQERIKLVEKLKVARKGKIDPPVLRAGMQVTVRNSPLYRPGACAFSGQSGQPCVGTLLDSVWNLTDRQRFRLPSGEVQEWRVQDAIFLHDGPGPQTGTVLKVDGANVAVFLPTPDLPPPVDVTTMWENSRLLRNDEVDDALAAVALPCFIHATPHRLKPKLAPQQTVMNLGLSATKLHLLCERADADAGYLYHVYDLATRSISETAVLKLDRTVFAPASLSAALHGAVVLVRDRSNTLYPMLRDTVCRRRPVWVQLPPIQALAMGQVTLTRDGKPASAAVIAMVLSPVALMQAVQTGNAARVEAVLASPLTEAGAMHCLDGARNVLHLCGDVLQRSDAVTPAKNLEVVKALLAAHTFHPFVARLLLQRNVEGYLPFFTAVKAGNYKVASLLLKHVLVIGDMALAMEMVNARDTAEGTTSLHMLCCMDFCTFTRTDKRLMEQDVFECNTCGISDSTCLCTPCASLCHAGHDCRYKGKAQAFCDCKDFGCCRPFPNRDSSEKQDLVKLILDNIPLDDTRTAAGTSLLFSLAWLTSYVLSIPVSSGSPYVAEHAQEDAWRSDTLVKVASNWSAVQATIMTGYTADHYERSEDDSMEIQQDCTAQLDQFTYLLFSTCPRPALNAFLATIIQAVNADQQALFAATRFVRSAVRVYSVLSAGPLGPDADDVLVEGSASGGSAGSNPGSSGRAPARAATAANKAQPYHYNSPVLKKLRTAFAAFPALAVQELAENADAVFSPIRLGHVRAVPLDALQDLAQFKTPFSMFAAGVPSHWAMAGSGHPLPVLTGSAGGRRAAVRDTSNYDSSDDEIDESTPEAEGQADRQMDESLDFDEDEDEDVGEPINSTAAAAQAAAAPSLAHLQSMTADMNWAIGSQAGFMAGQSAAVTLNPDMDPYDMRGMARRTYASASTDNHGQGSVPADDSSSIDALACLFSRLVKEMVDLTVQSDPACPDMLADPGGILMRQAICVMESQMERAWHWLCLGMDSLEAQLRTGIRYNRENYVPGVLVQQTSETRAQPAGGPPDRWRGRRRRQDAPAAANSTSSGVASSSYQGGFRQYLLSLMRGHSGEHGDTLPPLDVSRHRHMAYSVDAFMYYLKHRNAPEQLMPGAAHVDSFFLRSDSIVVGGAVAVPVFTTPIKEALPLADRPDKLHPASNRAMLFGGSSQGHSLNVSTASSRSTPIHLGVSSRMSTGYDTRDLEPRRASMASPHGTPAPFMASSPLNLLSSTGGAAASTNGGEGINRALPASANTSLSFFSVPAAAGPVVPLLSEFGPDVPGERWKMLTSVFVRLFLVDVGAERDSFLSQMAGFKVKEARFREEMERLKRACHGRDAVVKIENVPRDRKGLLVAAITALNSHYQSKMHQSQPFACQQVKASFQEEQGQGSGVARGFYSSIAEALVIGDPLPLPRVCSIAHNHAQEGVEPGMPPSIFAQIQSASEAERRGLIYDQVYRVAQRMPGCSDDQLARQVSRELVDSTPDLNRVVIMLTSQEIALRLEEKLADVLAARNAAAMDGGGEPSAVNSCTAGALALVSTTVCFDQDTEADLSPLFFCPGKPGFYSPRQGQMSPYRLSWFRNVGRLAGLCLLHNDIFPLSFNRHVIKYILGRKLAWHDLAFFDPELYEGLRRLVVEAERMSPEEFASLCLTFRILPPQALGTEPVELLPGHGDDAVTVDNVHRYIALYAEYVMVEACKESLDALRAGLLDVVPPAAFGGLTAEDFRLLLNGCPAIDVSMLKQCTTFIDETGRSSGGSAQQAVETTKRWFWSIVEHMSDAELHDLVYFWTSTPSLPATEAGFVPKPSVVVRPPCPDNGPLPSANTCVSRLSIPCYSSRKVLRRKLLMAIQTKTFAFV